MPQVQITLRRSVHGWPHRQREAIRTLGLRRIGQVVVRPDSPRLTGLLRRIGHLVEVRAVDGAS